MLFSNWLSWLNSRITAKSHGFRAKRASARRAWLEDGRGLAGTPLLVARPLTVERLEDRCLLATINLSSGNLTVTGTSGNDVLTISSDGTNLSISDGVVQTVPLASITGSVTIDAGAGNDTINFSGSMTGFGRSLTVNGGQGNDDVSILTNITFAAGQSLDVDLQNDDASPGTDTFILDNDADVITSGGGSITVKVSRAIAIRANTQLVTENGNLTLEANQQVGTSTGNFDGVKFHSNSLVDVTGIGVLTVKGRGGTDFGGGQPGVTFLGGTLRGGTTGTMTVVGTGGVSSGNFNYGVLSLSTDALITSRGANVLINAVGGGTGATSGSNRGVYISNGGTITAGGSGSVTVNGSGADREGGYNFGVDVRNGSITSSGGSVTVNGTGGGSGNANFGLGVIVGANGLITSGGSGNVSVIGHAGAGSNGNNTGVRVELGGVITANGTGSVTVTGTGNVTSTGNVNFGVHVIDSNSKITSGGGSITISGTGGGTSTTSDNYGVVVANGGDIIGGGSTTTVTGQGGHGDSNNYGVLIGGSGSSITAESGSLSVLGTGGNGSGTQNAGVRVNAGSAISSTGTGATAANVTVIGQGGTGGIAIGVLLVTGTISTVDGDVAITGTAGNTGAGRYQIGVNSHAGTIIESTGTGASAGKITITGQGGDGTTENTGIYHESSSIIRSVDGNVRLEGTSTDTGGSGQDGIIILTGSQVTTTGSANVEIIGQSTSTGVGFKMTDTSALSWTGQNNVIAADTINLAATATAISAAGKSVTFRQKTNGRAIHLGSTVDTTANTLELSAAELALVTAGTFNFGDTNSGTLTVNALPSGFTNLGFTSGGSIAVNQNIAVPSGGVLTVNGLDTEIPTVISGSGGLVQNGGGTLKLRGNNTYSGLTTINAGTVRLHHTNALGASSAGTELMGNNAFLSLIAELGTINEPLTLRSNSSSSRSELSNTAGVNNWAGPITIQGTGGIIDISAVGGAMTISGNVTYDMGANSSILWRGNGNGVFSGSQIGGGFQKTDGGIWTISGSGNTFTSLVVGRGTVRMGATNTLPANAAIGVNHFDANVQTLDLNGFSQTVASIEVNAGAPQFTNQILTNSSATAATLTTAGSTNTTYHGTLSGNLSLVKSGTGTLTLSGANTYSGTTSITGGTLLVTSALPAASAVTVSDTGTLGGTGTVGNLTANSGGTVSPGNSPGAMNVDNLVFNAGSTYRVELTGTSPSDNDLLDVTGTVMIATSGAGATLNLTSTIVPTVGTQFTILYNDGSDAISGTFAGLAEGALITNLFATGLGATISYVGGDGNDIVLTVAPPSVTYVDDGFALQAGELILDADLGSAGDQQAVRGINAFTTISAALAAMASSGTVIINSGNYSANLTITGDKFFNVTGSQYVTITGTLNGTGNLFLSGTGTTLFEGVIGATTPLTSITQTTTAGLVEFFENVTTGTGTSRFNGNVTLDGLVWQSSGDLQFGDATSDTLTITGDQVLLITADKLVTLHSDTAASQTFSINVGAATFTHSAGRTITQTAGQLMIDADSISLGGSLAGTGSGAVMLTAFRNIAVNGTIATADGAITLNGNQTPFSSTGTFAGVSISQNVTSTGGYVVVNGRGGDGGGSAGSQFGVRVTNGATVSGQTTTINGVGGSSSGGLNHGVFVDGTNSSITSNGGAVTVIGTGGGTGDGNGVEVGANSKIGASGTGAITITGTGAATTSSSNRGVMIPGNGLVQSAGGNITIIGTGGSASGGASNQGINVSGQIRANNTGNVTLIGTGSSGSGSNGGISIGSNAIDEVNTLTINGNALTGSGVTITGATPITTLGPITIDGVSTATTGGAHGIVISGSVDSADEIILRGTASASTTTSGIVVGGTGTTVNATNSLIIQATGASASTLPAFRVTSDNTLSSQSVLLLADTADLLGSITATDVTLSPLTHGRPIDLGGADVLGATPTLGLTDAELDRITANRIDIGDGFNTTVTVSEVIDRSATTQLKMISGENSPVVFSGTGSVNSNGGQIDLFAGVDGAANGSLVSGTAAADVIGSSVNLYAGKNGIGANGNSLVVSASNDLRLSVMGTTAADSYLAVTTPTTLASVKASVVPGGTLHLTNGTFNLAASNRIGDNDRLSVETGAAFDVGAFNEELGRLIVDGGTVTGTTGVLSSPNTVFAHSGTISAILGGSAGLLKATNGTVTLSSATTYTGTTSISGGTLVLTGSTANASTVSINLGTLAGTGTVNGALTMTTFGGSIAPGTSPGRLTVDDNVTWHANGSFVVEVNGTSAGTHYDQLQVTGANRVVTLNNATLSLSSGFTPAEGDSFVIIDNVASTSQVSGVFRNSTGTALNEGDSITLGGKRFVVSYMGGTDQNDVVLTVQAPTLSATLVGNDLVIEDVSPSGRNNVLSLSRDGSNNLLISDTSEAFDTSIAGATTSNRDRTLTIPASAIPTGGKIIVKGQAGNDTLTVETTNDLGFDIEFQGGSGTNDVLELTGSVTATRVTHSLVNATDGSVNVELNATDSQRVSYTSLEGVTDNRAATNRAFTFSGGTETIELSEDGTLSNNKSRIDSTLSVPVTFVTPTGALNINAAPTDDVILTAFDATGAVNFSAAANTVTLTGAIRTNGGSATLLANNGITLHDTLTTNGGAVTLSADLDGNGTGTVSLSASAMASWSQQSQLTSTGGAASDRFGNSVAVSSDGNTAIVGAHLDDVGTNGDQGSATIFTRSGSVWIQQAQLTVTGGAANDLFGYSVALSGDGNTAIVGAIFDDVGANGNQGTATIFTRSGNVWTQQAQLTATGGAAGDEFGYSVALSSDGNTAIVGAVGDDVAPSFDVGTATIFTRLGSVWTQQAQLTATGGAAFDRFGYSAALSSDGNTAIVGAYGDDVGANFDQGSATVFTRSGSVWTQQVQLTATGGATGDQFGYSVALSSDGNSVIVGAILDDFGSNSNQGTATIFTRSGSIWTQQAQLTAAGGATGDIFGSSVALSSDGNSAIVGAVGDDLGAVSDHGTATIFTRSGSVWTQQAQLTAMGGAPHDNFGNSVALSGNGNTAIVGAYLDDVGTNGDQGSAFTFARKTGSISAGAGVVTIRGADVDLAGSVSSTTSVSISSEQSGRGVNLGANVSGSLGLSSAELAQITAPMMNFGNSNSGVVFVNALPTGFTNLGFASGNSIAINLDINLPTNGDLALTGPASLSGKTITVNGGDLTANSLSINGTLQVNAGTVAVTGAVSDGGTSTVQLEHGTMTVGNGLSVDNLLVGSFNTAGDASLTVNGGSVRIGTGAAGNVFDVARRTSNATAVTGSGVTYTATADFSAASSVTINVDQLRVTTLADSSIANTAGEATGRLKLSTAGANTITANLILMSDSKDGGMTDEPSEIVLGNSANTINADVVKISARKGNGTLRFAGTGGTLDLRGKGGAGTKTNLQIANNEEGTNTISTGTVDLTGGTVNATLSTLLVGGHGYVAGGGQGTFTFGAGTVTADTVELADASRTGASTTLSNTKGTINQNGGTLKFGTLVAREGVADFNWSGGTIQTLPSADLTNSNVPIDLLTSATHTLSVDAGRTITFGSSAGFRDSGSLIKEGSGTLVLNGASSYSGTTTVNGGVVKLFHNSALGSTAGGTVLNQGNSVIELTGGLSIAEPLVMKSTSGASRASMTNPAGNNIWFLSRICE